MEVEVNKEYNYFHDGKIRESGKHPVRISEIIPFEEIDSETLSFWKNEVHTCHWLYNKETNYFIKGVLKLTHNNEEIIFVRALDGGWFSMGWWAGRLDVDGELTASLKN